MDPIELRTVAEVAEQLRMTPWQVTKMCREGKLRATKPGKSWLIPTDAVADLLDAHRNDRAAS